VALVVTRPGTATDEEDLLQHCRGELAGFKVPARVVSVPGLPTVGIGKIDRAAVRALVTGVGPAPADRAGS
jgi:fatty-acyl-CoA synthase